MEAAPGLEILDGNLPKAGMMGMISGLISRTWLLL